MLGRIIAYLVTCAYIVWQNWFSKLFAGTALQDSTQRHIGILIAFFCLFAGCSATLLWVTLLVEAIIYLSIPSVLGYLKCPEGVNMVQGLFPINFLLVFVVYHMLRKEEKPEEKTETDLLDRIIFYDRLHFWIRREAYAIRKGCAIAIEGAWGSGKSHMISYLKSHLSEELNLGVCDDAEMDKVFQGKFRVCEISLWHSDSDLQKTWTYITNSILKSLSVSEISLSKNRHVLYGLMACIKLFFPKFGAVSSAVENLVGAPGGDCYIEDAKTISSYIQRHQGMRLLIVMEDFERVDRKLLERILPLMERLKSIEGVTIVCSIAKNELDAKFSDRSILGGNVSGYLDKIFDLCIVMPELDMSAGKKMLKTLMAERFSSFHCTNSFFETFEFRFRTPREIYQAISLLTSLEWRHFSDMLLKDKKMRVSEYLETYLQMLLALVKKATPKTYPYFLSLAKDGKWGAFEVDDDDCPAYALDAYKALQTYYSADEICQTEKRSNFAHLTLNQKEQGAVLEKIRSNPGMTFAEHLAGIFKPGYAPIDSERACTDFFAGVLMDQSTLVENAPLLLSLLQAEKSSVSPSPDVLSDTALACHYLNLLCSLRHGGLDIGVKHKAVLIESLNLVVDAMTLNDRVEFMKYLLTGYDNTGFAEFSLRTLDDSSYFNPRMVDPEQFMDYISKLASSVIAECVNRFEDGNVIPFSECMSYDARSSTTSAVLSNALQQVIGKLSTSFLYKKFLPAIFKIVIRVRHERSFVSIGESIFFKTVFTFLSNRINLEKDNAEAEPYRERAIEILKEFRKQAEESAGELASIRLENLNDVLTLLKA